MGLLEVSETLSRCNKCGFCLAGCPVYKVTGIEWTAARGRLALLRGALEGQLKLDELKEPVLNCLTCNGCVDHCPSGITTAELIFQARADLLKRGQPWLRKLVFHSLLPHPERLRRLTGLVRWLQVSGLRSAARSIGLTRIIGDAGRAERVFPVVPFTRPTNALPRLEHPRYRVAYFTGCAANFAPRVTWAALRVLHKHQVEVVMPEFVCCGMPAQGYGDMETALSLARQNLDLSRSLNVDAIVVTCASCGSMLRQYASVLGGDAAHSAEAKAFSGKVRDISEFLTDIGLNTRMGTLKNRVTYHDPCHLGRFQKVTKPPRQLLRSIPGVEFIEMAEANMCCGAAGTYNVTHYDLSMKVLAWKMGNAAKTGADTLVTCCPGCSMQLAHGIREHKLGMGLVELVELLDLAYQSAGGKS